MFILNFFMLVKAADATSKAFILLPQSDFQVDPQWNKIASYQFLKELGCPVPNSVLIFDLKRMEDDDFERIRKHLGGNLCSLRFQYKTSFNLQQRRGGMKVSLSKTALQSYCNEDYMLWPVMYVDRVKNLYGVNITYKISDTGNTILYEIVGRGFDGTDLNKGDISPHQTIEVPDPDDRGAYSYIWKRAKIEIIAEDKYSDSVKLRKQKLDGLKHPYENCDFPEKFVPLQLDNLERLDRNAQKLFEYFQFEGGGSKAVNISATITEKNKVIFWDYQDPEIKLRSYIAAAPFPTKKLMP